MDYLFDTELLIEEVSNRPAIWNTRNKDFCNKNIKEMLWREIFIIIYPNWEQMDESEVNQKGELIQKKWKNLKDNFRKELKENKMIDGKKKKRPYIHFKQLLFLLPTMEERKSTRNFNSLSSNNSNEMKEESNSTPSRDTEFFQEINTNKKPKVTETPNVRGKSYRESLLKILQDSKKEDIDEDKYFLLSLLPSLQTLSDHDKFSVKMEFLKILQQTVCPSTVETILPQ